MRSLFAALIILALASGHHTHARWVGPPRADLTGDAVSWFNHLTNQKGMGCCSNFDGKPPEGVEWDNEGDGGKHYRVMLEGQWWVVPDEAVIKEPNKYGQAVVWYYPEHLPKGIVFHIRCFLPGTLS